MLSDSCPKGSFQKKQRLHFLFQRSKTEKKKNSFHNFELKERGPIIYPFDICLLIWAYFYQHAALSRELDSWCLICFPPFQAGNSQPKEELVIFIRKKWLSILGIFHIIGKVNNHFQKADMDNVSLHSPHSHCKCDLWACLPAAVL